MEKVSVSLQMGDTTREVGRKGFSMEKVFSRTLMEGSTKVNLRMELGRLFYWSGKSSQFK